MTRFVASLIDGLAVCVIIVVLIGALFILRLRALLGIFSFAPMIISWLYFAIGESSENQATLGKRTMGLVVTDMNGYPISFGRATGRYFAKSFLSGILMIGYIMAFFTTNNQALHDIVASTLVLKK